jgi:cytochrome c-type biogenesis protein CcmH/NrfF
MQRTRFHYSLGLPGVGSNSQITAAPAAASSPGKRQSNWGGGSRTGRTLARLRTAVGFLLLLFAAPASGIPQNAGDISKDYKEACDRLICQCGCNEQLSVCAMQNCSSATPMRAEIRERLQKGESVDTIVESFVARYGKQVLSAPTLQGFDITAWVMPFLILCLGGVVVGWIVVRMVRPAAVAEQAPGFVDPRVEQELRDFEEES